MADPVHWRATDPGVMWASTNVAEAIPGVSTPLNWSFLGDPLERGGLAAFHALGAISGREVVLGERAEDRFVVCFFGRTAVNVDRMRRLADGLPGTDGAAVEQQLFGSAREGIESASRPWRMPVVLAKAARIAATIRRDTLRAREETTSWWAETVSRAAATGLAEDASNALFRAAQGKFSEVFARHTVVSVLASGLFEDVARRAEPLRPGLAAALFSGTSGVAETEMLGALWDVSRGRADLDGFAWRYGYYGPDAGQISRPVWRTDRAALRRLVDSYAAMDESRSPQAMQGRAAAERAEAQRLVASAAGLPARIALAPLLRMTRGLVGLREIGKASYLRCIDVARIAANARGDELAAAGVLAEPGDVFFLTAEEAWGPTPPAVSEQVRQRRTTHEAYLRFRLPESWVGPPEPIVVEADTAERSDVVLSGIGVGGSAVSGTARLITDPSEGTLLDGEILVCETTDPSWTAHFLIAGGVVVQVGSGLSHAAIVARELGIPCLINVPHATRLIRTGDHVSLDPTQGQVHVKPGGCNDRDH